MLLKAQKTSSPKIRFFAFFFWWRAGAGFKWRGQTCWRAEDLRRNTRRHWCGHKVNMSTEREGVAKRDHRHHNKRECSRPPKESFVSLERLSDRVNRKKDGHHK